MRSRPTRGLGGTEGLTGPPPVSLSPPAPTPMEGGPAADRDEVSSTWALQ